MSGYIGTPIRIAPSARGSLNSSGSGAFAASESMDALLKNDESLSVLSREELVIFCKRLKRELETQEQHEQDSLNAQKAEHATTLHNTEACAASELEAQEIKIEELQSKNVKLRQENLELSKQVEDYDNAWYQHQEEKDTAVLEYRKAVKQLRDLEAKLARTEDNFSGLNNELDDQADRTKMATDQIKHMTRTTKTLEKENQDLRQQVRELQPIEQIVSLLMQQIPSATLAVSATDLTREIQKSMGFQASSTAPSSPAKAITPRVFPGSNEDGQRHYVSLSAELPSDTLASCEGQLGDSADHDDSGFWDDSFGHTDTQQNDVVGDRNTSVDSNHDRRPFLCRDVGSPATTQDNHDSIDVASAIRECKHSMQLPDGSLQYTCHLDNTFPVVEPKAQNSSTSSTSYRIMAMFTYMAKSFGAWTWAMQAVLFVIMVVTIMAESYQYRQWTNPNALSRAMFMAAEDQQWCVRKPRADYALSLIAPSGLPGW